MPKMTYPSCRYHQVPTVTKRPQQKIPAPGTGISVPLPALGDGMRRGHG